MCLFVETKELRKLFSHSLSYLKSPSLILSLFLHVLRSPESNILLHFIFSQFSTLRRLKEVNMEIRRYLGSKYVLFASSYVFCLLNFYLPIL